MSDHIDLAFRPKSYFGPERLEQFLLSRVKGAVLRKRVRAHFLNRPGQESVDSRGSPL